MEYSSSTTMRKEGRLLKHILLHYFEKFRKKRIHLKKEKILFYDDNAPSHTSNIAQAKKIQ